MQLTRLNTMHRGVLPWPILAVALAATAMLLITAAARLTAHEQTVRLPQGMVARPPAEPLPRIPVFLTANGTVIAGGVEVELSAAETILKKERDAIEILGGDPAQAVVVVRAAGDAPTGQVQTLIASGQRLGLQRFALPPGDDRPGSAGP